MSRIDGRPEDTVHTDDDTDWRIRKTNTPLRCISLLLLSLLVCIKTYTYRWWPGSSGTRTRRSSTGSRSEARPRFLPRYHIVAGVYILKNTMVGEGWVEEWPKGKINGSRGKRNKEKGEREKVRQKREETPQKFPLFLGAKLIFLGEGGWEIIWFTS